MANKHLDKAGLFLEGGGLGGGMLTSHYERLIDAGLAITLPKFNIPSSP